MTKREPGFTFTTTDEGHNLALYGVPAVDLDTATVERLTDEQYALVIAHPELYTPVKPAKSPKED